LAPNLSDTLATSGDSGVELTPANVHALNEQFNSLPTEKVLAWAWQRFGNRAAIGTSFQGAGLVMMHLAKQNGLQFPVFTLDTGLLFKETLELKERLENFYGFKIESLVPDLTVAQQEAAQGPELWKSDPDLCCTMRKVLPLQGKLSDLDCWITGLRREQSDTRASIGIIEIYTLENSGGRDIVKLNPMANWSRDAVWQYIKDHKIPYNPLHDQGYRSIGCWPCTRWTGFNKVECGIHTFLPKKADFQNK
jgi:phosphoadenosine phosphosulfate reductase